jgi:hypothetical protein
MLSIAVVVGVIAAAALAASTGDRATAASQHVRASFESWFGRSPGPPSSTSRSTRWPAAPLSMDVESAVAIDMARRLWQHQPPTTLMDGAALYLQQRIVSELFDRTALKSGAGVDTVALFGGTYLIAFPQLRFDGPARALRRDGLAASVVRAGLAFASLERSVGEPRMIGALGAVIERDPQSDDEVVDYLEQSLGQRLSWLFGAVDPSTPIDYSITNIVTESCGLDWPCERVRVEIAHHGAAFTPLEVRATFSDGQTASAIVTGTESRHELVFEGPSPVRRVTVDPDAKNLLDDDRLDQSRQFGAATNVPVIKWTTRWLVWLQHVMLSATAIA